jgi:hypothetical protein
VVFNAGKCPSCGAGTVLFDVTGSGNGSLLHENAWGISFHNSPELPDDIRINRIVIDLQGSGGDGVFVGSEVLDENDPSTGWAMRDQSGPLQPDIRGFLDLGDQTEFTNLGSGKLQIDFFAKNEDDGFEPGDRFRFGYDVDDVSSGNGHNDGDGIGRDGVTVTIYFSVNGNDLPPVTGKYFDNTERLSDALDTAVFNTTTSSYAVTPSDSPIPDLPAPATSSPGNNGQSYVLVNAGPQNKFAVRAQTMMSVRSFGSVFLGDIANYCVQAKATAVYDCLTRRVRLVRVDEFICPGSN